MNLGTMRPDDRELLRQAARTLRQATGASVVFGGLRSDRGVRVSVVSGARTDRLSSIDVRPSRGLGGISWQSGRPETVDDYGRATGITHHYDPQILGEGIQSLTVAPIVVAGQVRGLIYAGDREPRPRTVRESALVRVVTEIGEELPEERSTTSAFARPTHPLTLRPIDRSDGAQDARLSCSG